jgi:hypothetical protein
MRYFSVEVMPCHESLHFTVGEARHESCHTVVGLGSHAVVLAVDHTVAQGGAGSGTHGDVMSLRVTQRCRGQTLEQTQAVEQGGRQ